MYNPFSLSSSDTNQLREQRLGLGCSLIAIARNENQTWILVTPVTQEQSAKTPTSLVRKKKLDTWQRKKPVIFQAIK